MDQVTPKKERRGTIKKEPVTAGGLVGRFFHTFDMKGSSGVRAVSSIKSTIGATFSTITAALCWAHARRRFFELAYIAANARRGKRRDGDLADRAGSGQAHRRAVRHRARHQRYVPTPRLWNSCLLEYFHLRRRPAQGQHRR